jgi:alpha-tubulin suppressor-like RCC1 family protein
VSGPNHAVAITEEGVLYVWGNNDMGQLGLGTVRAEDTETRFKPTLLELLNPNGLKLKVMDVAVGLEHTLALVNGGRVYAWGSNRYGQLGLGANPETTPYSSIPEALDVGGELVKNVSAAAGHSAALTFNGGVYMWGANQEGQLGLGGCKEPDGRGFDPCLNSVQRPRKIVRTAEGGFMPQIKLVACGGHVAGGTGKALEGGHTIAISLANEVWGWGDNFHGQVGKPQEYTKIANHTEVYTPNKYDDVTGRYYNREVMPARVGFLTIEKPTYPPSTASLAYPPPPAVDGETAMANPPPPSPPALSQASLALEVVALKAGSHHSIALVRTGEMFAWGDNYHGQLGLGYISEHREPDRFKKTQEYRAPEMIDRPTRLKHFDYYTTKTTAVVQGNQTLFVEHAERVTGRIQSEADARITQIDAGNFQTIALSSRGNIYIWGTNALGQQGTCGCGACTANYDAAGTCPAIQAPPAPPSPEAPVIAGITYSAAPFVPSIERYEWNDECECNCAGAGTCKYTPQIVNTDAINAGRCVGFGENTKCECSPPYLEMTGQIHAMDTPMTFALGAKTNFTFVTVAAGGAMFAISEAECPTDNNGNECSNIGFCSADAADMLKTCECPFGTAVSFFLVLPSFELLCFAYSRSPCRTGYFLRAYLS